MSGAFLELKRQWRAIALVFAMLIVWAIGVKVLYHLIDGPGVAVSDRANNFALQMAMRLTVFLFFWMIIAVARTVFTAKDQSAIAVVKTSFVNDPWRIGRFLIAAILAMISFVWLQTNFMSVKTAIPSLAEFYLDETFRNWDRVLFFGNDPYQLFLWMYDIPWLIKLVDNVYTFWAAFVAGFWLYAFCSERMSAQRRFQYLFAMLLLWFIAGNVMATLLSSAGPCYYEYFTGDSATYAVIMEKLHALHASHNLGAVSTQDMLLAMYENPNSRFGGISAAPSLHVGASLMMLLLFWQNKIARALLILFNIVIYIGSIVLVWHYAVDGLLVLPSVALCWWLGGKISAKLTRA